MKLLRNRNGFSLLEVVIALAIFSISIIALYALQTRTITQNATASRITTAATWASEKIEDLIALSYNDLKEKSTDKDGVLGLQDSTVATADGNEVSPDGVYTVLWNVAEEKPLPNTKTIRMIVTSKRFGTGSKVELEYIKHKGI